MALELYKNNPVDKIWWVDNFYNKGEYLFSFDKKQFYNLFRDYPDALTKEQKEIFDKENTDLLIFFYDRDYIPLVKREYDITNIYYEWHASGPRYEDDLAGLNVLHYIVNISKGDEKLVFTRFFCDDKEGEVIDIPLKKSEIDCFFDVISKKEKENPSIVKHYTVCDGPYWKVNFSFSDGTNKFLAGKQEPEPQNIEYISNWIHKYISHLLRRGLFILPRLPEKIRTSEINILKGNACYMNSEEIDLESLLHKLYKANSEFDNLGYGDDFKQRITCDFKGRIILQFLEEHYPSLGYFSLDGVQYDEFRDIEQTTINEIKHYIKEGKRTTTEAIDIFLREDCYLRETNGVEWACELLSVGHFAALEHCLYPELLLEVAMAINLFDHDQIQKKFSRGERAVIDAHCYAMRRNIGEQAEKIVRFLISDLTTSDDFMRLQGI